jgi:Xaa-Pro aminopeptidase
VEVIKKALRASEAGFAAAVREVKPGMTELQACERVHQAAFEAAQQPVIVYGDFASGPRCEQGGGSPTLREIQPNELFLLDFSVVLHGYRGDLAHTFVVAGGKATSRQREMAEVCYAAMAAGEALLKPGAPGREVYQAVQRVFAENHLGERFPHHAGHGLGLGHPDPPYFVPESDDTLLAGDVVTLEPGAYIPGIGGMRFEHNYLITENGFERLSRHSLAIEPR